MPEISNDEEEFHRQSEIIENELGFKSMESFKVFKGLAHYGIQVTQIDEKNQGHEVSQKKAYDTASNPMYVMIDVWESIFHQSIGNGLQAIATFTKDAMEEENLSAEETLDNLLHMLSSEKFLVKFISNVFALQPDVIVIGNPQVVSNFEVQGHNTEEFSKSVEDFV